MASSKPSFPVDGYGNALPLLPVLYGSSTERSVAVGGIAAFQIHDAAAPAQQIVRIWSLAFGCYYRVGGSGVAQATSADAYVPKDGYMDVPLLATETHMRAIGQGGTATLRVELLGR